MAIFGVLKTTKGLRYNSTQEELTKNIDIEHRRVHSVTMGPKTNKVKKINLNDGSGRQFTRSESGDTVFSLVASWDVAAPKEKVDADAERIYWNTGYTN